MEVYKKMHGLLKEKAAGIKVANLTIGLGYTGVVLTSTSLIHGSTEEVLSHVKPGTPCVMLGPTTPIIPETFSHLPVTILGGMQPTDNEKVLQTLRHAKGTRDIQRHSRKVYWKKQG